MSTPNWTAKPLLFFPACAIHQFMGEVPPGTHGLCVFTHGLCVISVIVCDSSTPVFTEPPMNANSEENQKLRKYAAIMRRCLVRFQA